MDSPNFSRRKFLAITGVGAAGVALVPASRILSSVGSPESPAVRWSDPRSWGGTTPGTGDVAVVARDVVLDTDATVAGIVVKEGAKLIFNRNRNVTLSSRGNVVVKGRLVMRPRNSRIKHRLVFRDVREGAFVGGGNDVLSSDVGLWVMGKGRLNIRGAKKKAWTRVVGDVASGTMTITLKTDPAGWRRGDSLVIVPTGSGSDPDHYLRFDEAQVKAIAGRRITLSAPVSFAHPAVQGENRTLSAEVLNLTRNVMIQGTENGRAHIFIRSRRPQSIRNCAIRYMGPRKDGEKILGRWVVHFHHSGNGSRGSVVKGVVVRDAGSHAFVPHVSHNITFRDCIAYNNFETGFWWDPEVSDTTNGILWDHCVSALIKGEDGSVTRHRLSGFLLRSGNNNECRNCVAVGVQGSDKSAGFAWPQPTSGVWTFKNGVAHNNKILGVFAWENDEDPHTINGLTAYRNGAAAVEHGAYVNAFRYKGLDLIENGFNLHARSKPNRQDGIALTLSNSTVKNAAVGLLITGSVLKGPAPAIIEDWSFKGCPVPVEVLHKGKNPGEYNFNRCTVDGAPLNKSHFTFTEVVPESIFRINGQQIYP